MLCIVLEVHFLLFFFQLLVVSVVLLHILNIRYVLADNAILSPDDPVVVCASPGRERFETHGFMHSGVQPAHRLCSNIHTDGRSCGGGAHAKYLPCIGDK